MSQPIYHLAEPADWAGSTDRFGPPSVNAEGFIHCSAAHQLSRVARDLFPDHNGLILLTIDPEALDEGSLVWEDLYESGQDFPHIYGSMPTSAVVMTAPYLNHLEDGLWMQERRFDHAWIEKILHPDFEEVERSGRVNDRTTVVDTPRPEGEYEVDLPHADYRFGLIDEDVGMSRYVSRYVLGGVRHLDCRTSIWLNTNDGWQLRFHQGTPLSE